MQGIDTIPHHRRSKGWAAVLVAVLFTSSFFKLIGGSYSRQAAEYPNGSITLIVPWAAGGGTDRVGRFVADGLQKRLGKPVIVVNRVGGGGSVGHSAGALAPPDGRTLVFGTFELSTLASMGISELTWRDFEPVAQINADAAALFVKKGARWKDLRGFLDSTRDEPGNIKMSGTATGGAWDLARSGLMLSAGVSATNVIWAPTQGSAPALVELLGGHVDAVACSLPEAAAQIDAGSVDVLAVMGPARVEDFPQFRTAREQGFSYEAVGWRGVLAPKQTPREIIMKLESTLEEIVKSPEFIEFMKKNGFGIRYRSAREFADFLKEEEDRWGKVIRSAGYESLGLNRDPGPYAAPLGLGIALLGMLGIEAFRMRRRALSAGSDDTPIRGGDYAPSEARGFALGLVAYVLALPWMGFIWSTLLFGSVGMWRLGARPVVAGSSAALVVGLVHLLFVVLFKVQLP